MAVDNSHQILMFFIAHHERLYKNIFEKIIAVKKVNPLKLLILLYFQRNAIFLIIECPKKILNTISKNIF